MSTKTATSGGHLPKKLRSQSNQLGVELGKTQLGTIQGLDQFQQFLNSLAPQLTQSLGQDTAGTASDYDDYGGATDQERDLISQSTQDAYDLGADDIQTNLQESLQLLRSELAPGRGLRPDDSPIFDQGLNLATEAMRQQGRLGLGLRGQQAQQLLQYPLQRGQFVSDLKQRATTNRMALLGQVNQSGLGLASASDPSRLIAGLKGGSVQTTSNPGQTASGIGSLLTAASYFSKKDLKDKTGDVDVDAVLEKFETLAVDRWAYKNEQAEHIGPYAEDFQQAFQLGDGQQINVIDAIGVLCAAVKGLKQKVDHLEQHHGPA